MTLDQTKEIGIFTTSDVRPWDGCEDLWFETALRLREMNIPVAVNLPKWPQEIPQAKKLRAAGAQLTFRKRPPSYMPLIKRLLKKLVRRDPYQWFNSFKGSFVIFSQGCQYQGLEWVEAAQRKGIPYVLIVQAASDYAHPYDHTLLKAKAVYENALKCFFVSRANQETMERQMAISFGSRGFVLRNPLKLKNLAPLSYPSSKTIRLACVARLVAGDKGQDMLLDVLAQPKWKERPIEVSFYGYGVNETTLKTLCSKHGLDSKVTFHGHHEDIETIWKNHHALILCSRREGLPLVVPEAMACGRPCFVTDVGDSSKLVIDEKTGYLIPAPTIALIDKTLERAWQNRNQWEVMGQNAHTAVHQFFAVDPIEEFIQILNS